ncbi:hypothetical protein AAFF_G00396950 [Aldrovandia affinis]|uniref:Usherin n=1 Tax=Aldrovandia affinis TaxID=143900 RepID=A0AAD7SDJ0_9TELE|nr:hypothetical protein AAFF_G00396950 [Aldrovandia affinis]
MDSSNHLGCSKAPSQQPPPTGVVLSSGAIQLTWSPPDSPNSNALTYTLLRDTARVHTLQSHHPFEWQVFEDRGLLAHTVYSYRVVTHNVQGQTSSVEVQYRTLSAVPQPKELQLSVVGQAGPSSAAFNWTAPRNVSGPVERYVLGSVDTLTGDKRAHYTGLQTEALVTDLTPFTRYNFTLQACTNGGCGQSVPFTLITAQAPPQKQAAPRVGLAQPNALQVDWDPPIQLNGIIIRYDLFMRGPIEPQQTRHASPQERRVFSSSGWLNPLSVLGSANRNALTPPQTSTMVLDLQPFSHYQFRVLSVNMAGSALSDWITGRTTEGEPERMPAPLVSPVSSSSLRISWQTPQDSDARGLVTEYRVNIHQEQTSNPFAPSVISQVLYSASPDERSYTAEGLRPFQLYNFTVTLCTSLGCVSSLPVTGRTKPAAPEGLGSPKLKGLNVTVMQVSWDPPRKLNGPPPLYHVERTDVSFSDPFAPVLQGTRFPGHGYFKFPNTTLPVNTYFTGFQLSFRTRAGEGLILCAISPGEQEEYVALQMHSGRPFFLFDPQGSAVAVSPQNDAGKRYDDNRWHHVVATRYQAVGTIIVDNQYRDSSSTRNTRLVQQGFAGCLRDVRVKSAQSPSEIWEPLDWDRALDRVQVYESWEGCPANTEAGAQFLGQGFLELKPSVFSGGDNFEISFEFKTDQLNAVLLFAHDTEGNDYIVAELEGGILTWALRWGGRTTQVSLWVGLSYCDGGWNRVSLQKRGSMAAVSMNGAEEQQRGAAGALGLSSPLYLGGIPSSLVHRGLSSLLHGFGGCIRDVRLGRGAAVDLAAVSSRAVRVSLDGCLSADKLVNCRGNDSILVYTGRDRRTEDHGLEPFTEYLYRVMASGDGGWTSGPWVRARSRETVPQSVLPPSRVVCLNGSSAEVMWDEPAEVRGVIEQYIVRAYNWDNPTQAPVNATFPHTQHLTAPDGVVPPEVTSYPSSLSLDWGPPDRPNGIITEYLLYKDGSLIYRGNSTEFNITDLRVFSSHWLVLTACTYVGCTNSSQVNVLTAQLPPTHMDPPALTVLDSHSIYVQWTVPAEANGVLEIYTLYLSMLGQEPIRVYNSSQLFEHHTFHDLVPGSTYMIQIAACTGGGCTLSSPSMAHTEESTPESVPAPSVVSLSPDSFNVSWTPPLKPNGVVSSYGLWMNGVLVQNSSSLSCRVSGLSAWSLHRFHVQACTARGCTLGPSVESRTLEVAPVGMVALEVHSTGPHTVSAKWLGPAKPNGNLTYAVLFTGSFYQRPAPDASVETDTRALHVSGDAGQLVTIGGLLPFSTYSIRVNACNSQGCVESQPTAVTLPPGAPDGVMPPRLAAATPAALRVAWSAPMHYNAPGPLRYQLQMKATAGSHIQTLLDSVTTSFSHTAEGLQPYTEYQFRLVVSHAHGETASDWARFITAQDREYHLRLGVSSAGERAQFLGNVVQNHY